jgi:hypothetical protein
VVTIIGSVLQNTTIQAGVPTGVFTVDPENGNPVPSFRMYIISAYLKFKEKPPKQFENSQPTNTPLTWVEGYITSVVDPLSPSVPLPSALPDSLGTEGLMTSIGDKAGMFYPISRIYDTALDPYLDREILGEKIWGWFDVKSEQ